MSSADGHSSSNDSASTRPSLHNQPNVSDEESGPVVSSRRNTPGINSSDSEAETDIADSPPRPSKRGRRLIRKLEYDKTHNRSNSKSSANTSITVAKNRSTPSSRSISPKTSNRKVSLRDANGRTKLQKACEKGRLAEVTACLTNGARVNDKDYAGITALHEASLNGHLEIVDLLLRHGAFIDALSVDKDTPLIDAAANGHVEIVRTLLKKGANPLIVNTSNDTALSSAEKLDTPDAKRIIEILKEYHEKQKSLHQDISDTTRKVVDVGVSSWNLKDKLLKQTYIGNVEFVGKDLIFSDQKPEQLSIAGYRGHEEVISIILGVSGPKFINTRDAAGLTPLMYTVGRGHINCTRILLEHADPRMTDELGNTLIDYASNGPVVDSDEIHLIKLSIDKHEDNTKQQIVKKEEISVKREADPSTNKGVKKIKTNSTIDPKADSQTAQTAQIPSTRQDSDSNGKSNLAGSTVSIKHSPTGNSKPTSKDSFSKPRTPSVQAPLLSSRKTSPVIPSKEPAISSPKLSAHKSEPVSVIQTPKDLSSVVQSPELPAKVELTPEQLQLKLQKEKEEAAQREVYKQQQEERRKKKQQEIMNRISEAQQKKEYDRKQAEELAKLKEQRAKEEAQRQQQEAVKKKEKETIEKEITRRKEIRQHYPIGLQAAKFGNNYDPQAALHYLPLYLADIEGEEWCIDLQIMLLFGKEDFYQQQYFSEVKLIEVEDRPKVWNILFPIIGYDHKKSYSIEEKINLYEDGEKLFNDLKLNWVKSSQISQFLQNAITDDSIVKKLLTKVKFSLSRSQPSDLSRPSIADGPDSSRTNGTAAAHAKQDSSSVPFSFRKRPCVEGILHAPPTL
ncbi:BA75_03934T0 [Komagataella pastoris]|uniref:BA75_03934T0 n=1 Tax=Komagataella pastoris TaxID=4922 RepID=A0A1B2JFR2_PICPA|nr:BA75_03934T0 [Komagataella pastoris]